MQESQGYRHGAHLNFITARYDTERNRANLSFSQLL
jgi:hypothetical protein